MAVIVTTLRCDLQSAVKVQYLDGNLFSQDVQANRIDVSVFDGGEETAISGSVTADIVRADGQTVAATGGTIEGNVASIILPAAAYYIPGVVSIAVKMTTSGVVTTIACVVANVYRSSTDTVVDPGTILPSIQSLITQIETAVASIPADYSSLWTKLAPAFDSSASYVAGQYVTYNGGMYRFIKTHSGAWSASDVVSVNIGGDLSDLKSAITKYNSLDVVEGILTKANQTASGGATFTWNGDICTVDTNGAATTGANANILLSATNLPPYIKPGDKLYIKYSTTDSNVRLRVIFRNGTTTLSTFYATANKEIVVPDNANRWTISIYVDSGITVANATATLPMILNAPSNNELEQNVDTIKTNYFTYRGILPDNTNLNDVTQEGHYILVYGRTYTNDAGTGARNLVVYEGPTYIFQEITAASTQRVYKRKRDSGVWGEWEKGIIYSEDFISKGVLPSGTDIDDIKEEGHYLITNGYEYTNAPYETPSNFPSTLEVLKTTNNTILQRVTDFQGKRIYIRQTTLGVFPESWKSVGETIDKLLLFDDLDDDLYVVFRTAMYIAQSSITGYRSYILPVRKGDIVRIRTAARYPIGTYAIAKQNYIVTYKHPFDEDQTAITYVDDTVEVTQDGYIGINCIDGYYKYFQCEVNYGSASKNINDLMFVDAFERPQFLLEYDPNNQTKHLQTGPSMMGAIHHWGLIGASYDSGELNFTRTGATADQASSLDYYEYSWMSELARINGITDLYHYSNGGQNAKQWITLTGDTTVDNTGRGFCYPVGVETISQSWNGGLSTTSGIGPGGGCWWKMREDHENGDTKQAFILVLGSNDINNNNPHNFDWEELADGTYDETLYYKAGSIEDIGTYDYSTDTDTVPSGKTAGVVPGIVNSYAAYIGAILNRIIAIQPDAVIFVATIRNNFAWNENSLAIWNGYNNVLKQIVQMDQFKDNCYLVDFAEYGPNYMQRDLHTCLVGMHPNAIGYHEIAYYYGTLINYAIQSNLEKFRQSAFIGTGKKYDPAT